MVAAKESVSSSDFNLILIHLQKPTYMFTAGLSVFLQCIKTLPSSSKIISENE